MALGEYAAEPMTESMEEAIDTSQLTKRKAESDLAEESEETGEEIVEYYDSDDELKEPTWFKVPVWGQDSFDEFEYDSSKEDNEFSNDEDEGHWRRFKRQLVASKGFCVEPELSVFYGYSRYKSVCDSDLEMNAGFGQTYRTWWMHGMKLAKKASNLKSDG